MVLEGVRRVRETRAERARFYGPSTEINHVYRAASGRATHGIMTEDQAARVSRSTSSRRPRHAAGGSTADEPQET